MERIQNQGKLENKGRVHRDGAYSYARCVILASLRHKRKSNELLKQSAENFCWMCSLFVGISRRNRVPNNRGVFELKSSYSKILYVHNFDG
jgi:hypothetical protein